VLGLVGLVRPNARTSRAATVGGRVT